MDRGHQVTFLLGHVSVPQFFWLLIANILSCWIYQPLKRVEGPPLPPPAKASLATIFPQILASVTFHPSIHFRHWSFYRQSAQLLSCSANLISLHLDENVYAGKCFNGARATWKAHAQCPNTHAYDIHAPNMFPIDCITCHICFLKMDPVLWKAWKIFLVFAKCLSVDSG